jgi:hypothetical protein
MLITAVHLTAGRCISTHIVVDGEDRLASDGDTDRAIGRHLQEADSQEQGAGCRENKGENREQRSASRDQKMNRGEQGREIG